MDHIGILKNAFRTTIRYRALWVLGFLWALVGGGGLGSGGGSGGSGGDEIASGGTSFFPEFDPVVVGMIFVALCGVGLILGIVATVARYVLQAGIYRSLDDLDCEGVAPTVGRGWREGWQRRTWRLLGQNLLVGVVVVTAALITLALAASPLLLLLMDSDIARVLGVVGAVGLGLIWLLALIIVLTVVGLLQEFWWRAAVVDNEGALASIGTAWRLVRSRLKDVLIMWLLMMGVGIAAGIAFIPVVLIVLALAAVIGGGPGYLLYLLTDSVGAGLAWGLPVGLVILIVPLVFATGLYIIFRASVWSQVYRQLVGKTTAVAPP